MVVDLAVECDPDGAVLVRERLPAALAQIDDAQPPVPERYPVGHIRAVIVGTPMHQ